MKYTKKPPKTDMALSQQLQKDGWKKIKEPKNLSLAVLFSFPLSCLLLAITVSIAYLLNPNLFRFIASDSFQITIQINFKTLFFIAAIWGYMFAHEMIHAIFIPNFFKSDNTRWGLNGLFGFVYTTEPINKMRFQIISCMPFILLSIAALLLFTLTGYLNGYTLALCLINAAGSCVDFLNMILIATQVKKGCTIINNGFETYYR